MFLRQAALFFIGCSSGGVIAAGIFAFLAIIGVFPRMIHSTDSEKNIWLYETLLILGGIWGNLIDLYHLPIFPGGDVVLAVCGLTVGAFVGCLVMSLAETLKALPVLNRRIRLSVGLQYVILSIAAGKLGGSLLYFTKGFGGA
ncbi:MAG: stage V sporulation protein AB [Lachnospiraceae bacterium]|jgi:stage V sporulation protein AB|nr:stage V sporulation protein AB [Lachnospiraceae bacterium]NBJ80522.1 stage V sporulation protein AB [bacterium 1XD42-76]NBK03731.1 stage V sporulation protein AB [bacterium 1XD42-94]